MVIEKVTLQCTFFFSYSSCFFSRIFCFVLTSFRGCIKIPYFTLRKYMDLQYKDEVIKIPLQNLNGSKLESGYFSFKLLRILKVKADRAKSAIFTPEYIYFSLFLFFPFHSLLLFAAILTFFEMNSISISYN